jgi:putative aldouronate transport system permease protein
MRKTYYSENWGTKTFDVFNTVILLLLTGMMIYPFVNQMAVSLNEGLDASFGGIYFIPRKFSLENYEYVFQNKTLLRGTLVSVLRVVVGVLTCVVCTGLLAYVVTVRSFSGRRLMRLLYIISMYVMGGLVPFYILIIRLHLNNTFHVYYLPHLFNTYYMLIMASYMQNIPEAVAESARIDGAREISIYFRIIIPMASPVFACIAIFAGVYQWNSWFDVSLFCTNGHWDNIQIMLRRLLAEVQDQAEIRDMQMAYRKFLRITPVTIRAATTMIVTLPIVFIYPFFQRYFVGGITIGAVKG